MARALVDIAAPFDVAWACLQQLATWEGVAGIEDLRDPRYDGAGHLAAFRFAMDTAVGRVDGRASVEAVRPGMTIRASQKGLEITLHVVLFEADGVAQARIDARSKATSFLSKPLELTLNALLDSSIEREAAMIAARIGPS